MQSVSRRVFLESGLASVFPLLLAAKATAKDGLSQDKKQSLWECAETRLVWDRAVDNEFTDLVRFWGRFICTFREGLHHTSPVGKIRVFSSADGKTWRDEALLAMEGRDLRNPKLSIAPDGRLMLCTASVVLKPSFL